MKKVSSIWLYLACALLFSAIVNLQELPGIIAMAILAVLWLADRGFRRLFDV